MAMAKERQAKRRTKIKADLELYQAQLLKDRERKKHQRKAQREKKCQNSSYTNTSCRNDYALRITDQISQ